MRCPFCGSDDTRVVDSRPAEEGGATRRRRECAEGHRFTTYERPAVVTMVLKRNGEREPFDIDKVRRGVRQALADRPVVDVSVEELVAHVQAMAGPSVAEVSAEEIGRTVLDGLRELDEVAYLRFVSVYKDFEGAGDFEREMAALGEEHAPSS